MKPMLITVSVLCALSGCATSLLEERVITDFVDALDEKNESAARRMVSTRFENKAMRSDDVFRDLEMVKLPKGEIKIVEIAEPTKDTRSVIASDDSGDKYKFELIRDPEKQRWAVNDVLVRQQKKWKKVRSNVTWPTSQVLDLVFSVREYLDVWSQSQRSQILAKSSPALAASLESVPESWLPVITNGIAANYDSALARKPEAQLNGNAAVVRMPVRGGYLLVNAVQIDDRWRIDDIEIHGRSESGHPGSVRRQADAVGSLSRFLKAFASGDRQMLQDNATPQFYNGTLQFADLKLLSLPSVEVAPSELSIRAFSGRVIIIVPTEREFVRFDLVDPNRDAEKRIARDDAPRQFHVDGVVLNDRTRRNERTLGSVFTAPARASLFVTALQTGDVPMLKQLSTRELNTAIWDRVSPDLLSRLTLPVAQLKDMTLEGSDVRGNRTELTFRMSSGGQVKCRMQEQVGRLLVNDIQFTNAEDQILSLRVQVALQIPIAEFTAAWRANDLKALKETCSTAFDRTVLNHFTTFPPDTVHLADRLDTVLKSTRVTEERATVHMGLTSSDTAEVHLIQEHDRWVIDDISILGSDGQTVQIRSQLRRQVADNMLVRFPDTRRQRQSSVQRQSTGQQLQPRVSRPVQVVQQAGGAQIEPAVVVPAAFQVFGPNSADVTRKLMSPIPNETHPISTPADRQRGIRPSAGTDSAGLKPVPHAATPLDDGQFLHFGPGFGSSKQPPNDTAGGSRGPAAVDVPASKTLDLGINPVSVE